jgi:hypothetical protein
MPLPRAYHRAGIVITPVPKRRNARKRCLQGHCFLPAPVKTHDAGRLHTNLQFRNMESPDGYVALARRLLIELWRYLETGALPDGARTKS